MFGKQQKRKIAIVKFVKIIVESSNAVAIGYAPILRLPSGFLSDFFVKKRPTFRPPLRRISRSTFRPVCRPVITPVDGYQRGYHKKPERTHDGYQRDFHQPEQTPEGYQRGYHELKQTPMRIYAVISI
jgi:hypothetical protein